MHHNRVHQELDDLVEAHRAASGSSQKRIKKDIDLRRKDLESLKGRISHEESYLQEDTPEQDVPVRGNLLDQGAEVEILIPEPMTLLLRVPQLQSLAHTPSEDPVMEVDDGAVGLPPTSPVS